MGAAATIAAIIYRTTFCFSRGLLAQHFFAVLGDLPDMPSVQHIRLLRFNEAERYAPMHW
jgi:hypothetical protein